MKYLFTTQLEKDLKKIGKKSPQLITKIEKRLTLFAENSHHAFLRTHRLKGKLAEYFSISIASDLRMLYYVDNQNFEDIAVFFMIGSHDRVYQKFGHNL